jgi:hypothetical protein
MRSLQSRHDHMLIRIEAAYQLISRLTAKSCQSIMDDPCIWSSSYFDARPKFYCRCVRRHHHLPVATEWVVTSSSEATKANVAVVSTNYHELLKRRFENFGQGAMKNIPSLSMFCVDADVFALSLHSSSSSSKTVKSSSWVGSCHFRCCLGRL